MVAYKDLFHQSSSCKGLSNVMCLCFGCFFPPTVAAQHHAIDVPAKCDDFPKLEALLKCIVKHFGVLVSILSSAASWKLPSRASGQEHVPEIELYILSLRSLGSHSTAL